MMHPLFIYCHLISKGYHGNGKEVQEITRICCIDPFQKSTEQNVILLLGKWMIRESHEEKYDVSLQNCVLRKKIYSLLLTELWVTK